MSKLQPIITLLTFFLSFSALTNTNTQIDSLKSLFWKETDTHKKIDLADHLITTYRSGPIDSNFYSNTDSVIKYAWLAIRLSNHTKERPKLTKLFWRIGGCYAEKHDLDSAIVNYKKAISSIKPGADTIPQLRMNLGIAYKRKGEYHLALDSYQKSLDIAKSLKDGLSVGYLYDGIGSLYNELKQPDKALEYYALSVEALENSSHPFANSFKAQAFINSATVMIEKGNTDSARTNLLMAKDIFEGYKNERALAFTYATLGQVFYKEKDFENSIKYYKLTQNTARKLNDVSAIMSSSLYLAQSLHSTKRSQEALKIIDKALAIAKEKKLYSDIQKLSGVKLDVMKDLNIKNGIHETIALHLAAKDSVFNVENQKTFLEMQTKYETVQKEKELSDKNHALSLKENQLLKEKSRTQTVILTFGFLLILVTLTVFIFRARQRRKHYNQLKTLRQRLMRVQMNPHFFFNALNSIG
ncbi:MAG: tetratricopeptide repeat protein, partial [Flavobacteriales bacterium]|nr:tetratricopeptide repeat protein [Flavobacteriales bacterium]